MSEENYQISGQRPDRWELLEFTYPSGADGFFKVFATWLGGYIEGDCWRLNSGISGVEDEGDHWVFHGASGSVYLCGKNSVGTSMYTEGVLSSILRYSEHRPDSPTIRRVSAEEIPEVIRGIMEREGSE